MIYPTFLQYTCVPSPLTTGKKQDLLIIATLKNKTQLEGQAIDHLDLQKITLDFGKTGTGPTDLCEVGFDDTTIIVPNNWTIDKSGLTCTLVPGPGSGLVTNNALVIVIKDVAVNNAEGNVSLTVTEVAIPFPQQGSQSPDTGSEVIVLPKIDSKHEKGALSANPKSLQVGSGTTLSWSGINPSASCLLHYIIEGNLVTISQHADGSPLSANDIYPNPNLSPPDPTLVLNETTNFILRIEEADRISHLTVPVIVEHPHLYASQASIPVFNGDVLSFQNQGNPMFEVSGVAGDTTITINTDSGVNAWTKLIFKNKSSSWTIGTSRDFQGNELYIYNDKGAGTAISETGNLNVNGNISNQGQGGRTFLGTLSEANAYTAPSLFKGPGTYRRYEIIFNGVKVPASTPNLFFGARLYVENAAQQPYSDMIYFSEGIGDSEGHCDSFMRLWYAPLTDSNNTGIIGSLTLFAHESLAYYAHTYAPAPGFIYAGRQCLISGGLNTTQNLPLQGIEFGFYDQSPDPMDPVKLLSTRTLIQQGTIDIYGWS